MADDSRWFEKNHFSCRECHKIFNTKRGLYLHAENCLLMGLEMELATMIQQQQQQTQQPSTSSVMQNTVVIKSLQYQPFEQATRIGAIKKPTITLPPGITIKTTTREPIKEEFVRLNMPRELQQQNWTSEELIEGVEVEEQVEEEQSTSEQVEDMAVLERVEYEHEPSQKMVKKESKTESECYLEPTNGDEELQQQTSEAVTEENVEDDDDDSPPPLLNEAYEDDEEIPGAVQANQSDADDAEEIDFHYLPGHQTNGNLINDDPSRPKIECPTCGLVLYRHNFASHYRIHTGEMPYLCPHCFKKFRTSSSRKVHVRSHTGEKPYSCPSCHYSTITKRNLDRHIINHHVRTDGARGPVNRKSRYPLLADAAKAAFEEGDPRPSRQRPQPQMTIDDLVDCVDDELLEFPDEVYEEVVVGNEYNM